MQAKVQLEHSRLIEDRHLLEKKRTHKKKKQSLTHLTRGNSHTSGLWVQCPANITTKKSSPPPFPPVISFLFFSKYIFHKSTNHWTDTNTEHRTIPIMHLTGVNRTFHNISFFWMDNETFGKTHRHNDKKNKRANEKHTPKRRK